jgi:hypothetical protein
VGGNMKSPGSEAYRKSKVQQPPVKTTSVNTAAVIIDRSIIVLEAERCRRKCHVLLKLNIQNWRPSVVPHAIEAHINSGPASARGEGAKLKASEYPWYWVAAVTKK